MSTKDYSPPKFGEVVTKVLNNINQRPEMAVCQIYLVLTKKDVTWTLGLYNVQAQKKASVDFVFDEENILTVEESTADEDLVRYNFFFKIVIICMAHYYSRSGYGKLLGYGVIKEIVNVPTSWDLAVELWKNLGFKLDWVDPDDAVDEGAINIHPEISNEDFQLVFESTLYDNVMLTLTVTQDANDRAEQLLLSFLQYIGNMCQPK